MASIISASTTSGTALNMSADTTGVLQLATGATPTTAVTIDASQNVGIGITSPSYKLQASNTNGDTQVGIYDLASGSSAARLDIRTSGTGASQWLIQTGNTASGLNGSLRFYDQTVTTERMRIASNGDVLIGQTTNPATSTVVIKVPTLVANGVNAQITSNTGTSYPWSNYNATGSYVGGITCTSSATAFPTSSDKRLKKNIEDAPSAIDKILTAQVVSHDWIDDNTHVDYGFVAQDLQSIIPQAVIEGTDKEDGSINMPWGVDYSKIVPLLTKAIQEQQAIINDLKARVIALENA